MTRLDVVREAAGKRHKTHNEKVLPVVTHMHRRHNRRSLASVVVVCGFAASFFLVRLVCFLVRVLCLLLEFLLGICVFLLEFLFAISLPTQPAKSRTK